MCGFTEVEQKFKAIEGSRTQRTKNAIKSIQGAAAKIANLIEKIIDDAADGDHSGRQSHSKHMLWYSEVGNGFKDPGGLALK